MLLAPALLALALASAPARPALGLEQGVGVRRAQAALTESGTLAVELELAFPATAARRALRIEALDADGRVLFTREAVARAGMNDARHHRTVRARASIALPELGGVARLRLRTGA